jgi:hypothetical protein
VVHGQRKYFNYNVSGLPRRFFPLSSLLFVHKY